MSLNGVEWEEEREEKKERWFHGRVNHFSIAVIRQCDMKGLMEDRVYLGSQIQREAWER